MIMKQYSHVSIEMTAHYLTLQEEEVKEIYSDMILSPESKIAGLRAKEIKGKLDDLFHGKTEDEIDDVITDLALSLIHIYLPSTNSKLISQYRLTYTLCSDLNSVPLYESERK